MLAPDLLDNGAQLSAILFDAIDATGIIACVAVGHLLRQSLAKFQAEFLNSECVIRLREVDADGVRTFDLAIALGASVYGECLEAV